MAEGTEALVSFSQLSKKQMNVLEGTALEVDEKRGVLSRNFKVSKLNQGEPSYLTLGTSYRGQNGQGMQLHTTCEDFRVLFPNTWPKQLNPPRNNCIIVLNKRNYVEVHKLPYKWALNLISSHIMRG